MTEPLETSGGTAPLPKLLAYPFFLVHMLMFGVSGFDLAYGSGANVAFAYMHGGVAIVVYTMFYVSIFGRDAVKWMFINAALGIFGIYSQLGWVLEFFGRKVEDYPWYVHVVPALYFVLYTFLLRQLMLDLTGSRNRPALRRWVEGGYVVLTLAIYHVSMALH